MILFYGIPTEPPMQRAIEAAVRLDIDHVVVHQRRSHDTTMTVDVTSDIRSFLDVDGRRVCLEEQVTGVYFRPTALHDLPEYATDTGFSGEPRPMSRPGPAVGTRAAARARRLSELLFDWADSARCRVANRPSAMASNTSKPLQAQLIGRCGFDTPPTLITNDPRAAEEFIGSWDATVFKSTSSVRSIVRTMNDERLTRLDNVRHLPTQFQAYVAGDDIRVHVVGDEVYATRAVSDADDYRYAIADGTTVDLEAVTLPDDVADRCRRVATHLSLPFCGIDLRRDGDSWYCFEANPSPAYSWYQNVADQPIAEALVTWLDRGMPHAFASNVAATAREDTGNHAQQLGPHELGPGDESPGAFVEHRHVEVGAP